MQKRNANQQGLPRRLRVRGQEEGRQDQVREPDVHQGHEQQRAGGVGQRGVEVPEAEREPGRRRLPQYR